MPNISTANARQIYYLSNCRTYNSVEKEIFKVLNVISINSLKILKKIRYLWYEKNATKIIKTMTKMGTPILRTSNVFPSDLKTTSVDILSDPPRLEAVHVYFPAKVISWASDEAIWSSWGMASWVRFKSNKGVQKLYRLMISKII